jgi:hypothetical protein
MKQYGQQDGQPHLGGFNEEEKYDEFPRGAEYGFGPDEGYNRWVRLNDPELFTPEARNDPVIAEFLRAPFTVNYAQFTSSTRESEYFVHKPQKAMMGEVKGVEGGIANMPRPPRIATLIVNHERTLAKRITRSITIEDGEQAGQMIHKEEVP